MVLLGGWVVGFEEGIVEGLSVCVSAVFHSVFEETMEWKRASRWHFVRVARHLLSTLVVCPFSLFLSSRSGFRERVFTIISSLLPAYRILKRLAKPGFKKPAQRVV